MASKLYVGNLPHGTTDTALNEFVTNAGFQVASATVIRDKTTGASRGFGFVELGAGEELQRAIAGLNGQTLEGRALTVNEARPQATNFADFATDGAAQAPSGAGGTNRSRRSQ